MLYIKFKDRPDYTTEQRNLIQAYNDWMEFILSTESDKFRHIYLNVWDKLGISNSNLPDSWYKAQQELRNNIPNQDSVWRDDICPAVKAKVDDYRDTLVDHSAFADCQYDEMDPFTRKHAEAVMKIQSYCPEKFNAYNSLSTITECLIGRIMKALNLIRFDTEYYTDLDAALDLWTSVRSIYETPENDIYFAICYTSGIKKPTFNLIIPEFMKSYSGCGNINILSYDEFFNDLVHLDDYTDFTPDENELFHCGEKIFVQNTKKYLMDKTERLVTRVAFLGKISAIDLWYEKQTIIRDRIPKIYTIEEIEVKSGMYNILDLKLTAYTAEIKNKVVVEEVIAPSVGKLFKYNGILMSPIRYPEIAPVVGDSSEYSLLFVEPEDWAIYTICVVDKNTGNIVTGGKLNRNISFNTNNEWSKWEALNEYNFVSYDTKIYSDSILKIDMISSLGKLLRTYWAVDTDASLTNASLTIPVVPIVFPLRERMISKVEDTGTSVKSNLNDYVQVNPIFYTEDIYSKTVKYSLNLNTLDTSGLHFDITFTDANDLISKSRMYYTIIVKNGLIENSMESEENKYQKGYFAIEVDDANCYATPLCGTLNDVKFFLDSRVKVEDSIQTTNKIEFIDESTAVTKSSMIRYDDTINILIPLNELDSTFYQAGSLIRDKLSASLVWYGHGYHYEDINENIIRCDIDYRKLTLNVQMKDSSKYTGKYIRFTFKEGFFNVMITSSYVNTHNPTQSITTKTINVVNKLAEFYFDYSQEDGCTIDYIRKPIKTIDYTNPAIAPTYKTTLIKNNVTDTDISYTFTMDILSNAGYHFTSSNLSDSIRVSIYSTSYSTLKPCTFTTISNSNTEEHEVAHTVQRLTSSFSIPEAEFPIDGAVISISLSGLHVTNNDNGIDYELEQVSDFEFSILQLGGNEDE